MTFLSRPLRLVDLVLDGGIVAGPEAPASAYRRQPGRCASVPGIDMGQCPTVGPRPGLVDQGPIVGRGHLSPFREQKQSVPIPRKRDVRGSEDACRKAICLPSAGHGTKVGQPTPARRGWHYLQWPSGGTQ